MKTISKTKLKLRSQKKTRPELKETIALALKNPNWKPIAKILSSSTRKFSSINLFQLDKKAERGDTVIIPGKILSSGELTKQLAIVALSISPSASGKLTSSKSKFHTILQEIKENPKMEGIKILR
jgi:large subunit ribosomal protein L18e